MDAATVSLRKDARATDDVISATWLFKAIDKKETDTMHLNHQLITHSSIKPSYQSSNQASK